MSVLFCRVALQKLCQDLGGESGREGGEGGREGGGREEGRRDGERKRWRDGGTGSNIFAVFMTESKRERETERESGGGGGAKVPHSGSRLVLRVFVSIPQHVVEPASLRLVQCPQLHPAAHLHT